jgi:type I restriction enzyme S subunit
LKKGWETKRLGDLAELKGRIGWRGLTAKEYTTSGPLFLSVHSLNYGDYVDFRDAFHISELRYEESPEIMLQKDDVLICKDGAGIGKVGITGNLPDRKVTINSSLLLIRSHGNVLPKFLYRCLSSPYFQQIVNSRLNGATTPHLYQRDITEFPVIVPTIPEQRRIVAILDEAFAAIATAKANTEKNLQNARAIFESHLNAVLRSKKWKWTTLEALCEGFEYGSSAKSKKVGKVPVLRMGNIQNGQLNWDSLVYTDDKEEIAKYSLKHNDVLFNRTNSPELVGKTAIYKGEAPSIFAGYLIRIRRKEELLDSDFLTYFLNSQIAFDYGKTVLIGSVNQANISSAKLKSYPIPAPTIAEQKVIVRELDALRTETHHLSSLCQRKLAALDELKKSLLHQAFNGEL